MIALLLVIARFGRSVRESFHDPEFRVLLGSAGSMLLVGSVFYHNYEHWDWLDSVYFCTITLATVGYGDLTPTTDIAKVFTIFYVIFGLGIIGGFINYMAKRTQDRAEQRVRQQLMFHVDDPAEGANPE